jgi:chromosome segregation and condensation protein ScpB
MYCIEHSQRWWNRQCVLTTPEDLIDELCHKVALASNEAELEAALDELQSALQEHREQLESVAADYRLSLPLAIRKRLSKLHETIAV